jgi:geranylgeranyl reductase family protein
MNPETLQAEVFDALVVGTGPAGASAAYHLARAGARVLLVDRWQFPRDKACGDGIVPQSVAELALLGITEADLARRFQRVERVVSFWPGERMLSAPLAAQKDTGGERTRHLPPYGFVAPRLAFDDLVRGRALEAGALFYGGFHAHTLAWPDEDVVDVAGQNQQGEVLRFRARFVVAADGSSSRLARLIQQERERRGLAIDGRLPGSDDACRATAMRAYLPAQGREKPAGLEFYFERDNPAMLYFWVFPLPGDQMNVGVIVTREQLRADQQHGVRPDLHGRLRAFLTRIGYDPAAMRAVRAAPIAMGLRGACLSGPRAICVGDAACLVSPLSAEGISEALASGRLAAKTIAGALAGAADALPNYDATILAAYLPIFDEQLARRRAQEMMLMALAAD